MSTAQFLENTINSILFETDNHFLNHKLTQKDYIKIKDIIKEECKRYVEIEKKVDDLSLSPSLLVPYLEKIVLKELLKKLKVLLSSSLKNKETVYEINFIYWGFLMQNLLWFEQIEKSENSGSIPV